jgi:rare lipoprotein A
MLNTNKVVPGTLTRSRTAFALMAATLLVGGSISEASAKSRHHRHHHHHASKAQAPGSNWLDANASIGSQSTGRGFSGKASFYGNESGSKTASGQRFNQNAMTAAHRSLPFGTLVRVTNLGNGRTVVVVVDDRGPFVRGRVIDLSLAAARRLGMVRDGVVPVRLEVVRWAGEPAA